MEIVVAIFSSFVASSFFLFFLRNLRPSIDISKVIAVEEKQDCTVYQVKIINRSPRNVVDLRAELLLVKSVNVPGGSVLRTEVIPLKKDKAFILSAFNANDKDAQYALRFTTTEDMEKLWSDEDTQHVVFRIYCHDETSGFGKVFSQEYRIKRNALKSGQFHFGNDLAVS
jgi:hypothetical protein